MALGFGMVVAPPTARVRRRGPILLDVLTQIPAPEQVSINGVADRDVSQRWRMGVKFQRWPRGGWVTLDEDPCVDHTKGDPQDFLAVVEADPFTAYKSVECSTLSADIDDFRMNLTEDSQFEASDILATRLFNPATDLNLPDSAALTLAAETQATRAIGAVDNALDLALAGAQGIVIMDAQTAAVGYGALQSDGVSLWTLSGHRVVIQSQARTLATADGGGALGVDDGMVYGLGPLYAAITGAEFFGEAGEVLDLTRNTVEIRAEVFGLVAFDPATVFAQRVCLPTC